MDKCGHLYNKPQLKNKYLNKFYKDIQSGHKILKNTKVIIETVKIESNFDAFKNTLFNCTIKGFDLK